MSLPKTAKKILNSYMKTIFCFMLFHLSSTPYALAGDTNYCFEKWLHIPFMTSISADDISKTFTLRVPMHDGYIIIDSNGDNVNYTDCSSQPHEVSQFWVNLSDRDFSGSLSDKPTLSKIRLGGVRIVRLTRLSFWQDSYKRRIKLAEESGILLPNGAQQAFKNTGYQGSGFYFLFPPENPGPAGDQVLASCAISCDVEYRLSHDILLHYQFTVLDRKQSIDLISIDNEIRSFIFSIVVGD